MLTYVDSSQDIWEIVLPPTIGRHVIAREKVAGNVGLDAPGRNQHGAYVEWLTLHANNFRDGFNCRLRRTVDTRPGRWADLVRLKVHRDVIVACLHVPGYGADVHDEATSAFGHVRNYRP